MCLNIFRKWRDHLSIRRPELYIVRKCQLTWQFLFKLSNSGKINGVLCSCCVLPTLKHFNWDHLVKVKLWPSLLWNWPCQQWPFVVSLNVFRKQYFQSCGISYQYPPQKSRHHKNSLTGYQSRLEGLKKLRSYWVSTRLLD